MEIPRHWRLKKQRYGLVGEWCPHCDKPLFPPRDVCPNCGDKAEEEFKKYRENVVFETRKSADKILEKA